ncbi:unnamed protein product [Adineta steineri]|uniref:Uncharacterized protein n=1 Tax=Adineta steineri TaxID=433720 RepID=A0A814EBA0_9BILA|nr:unnamed protein product [Adineta steineri]
MIGATIKHIATVFPVNAEALKSETKLQQHRVIIKDFSLNTSTHGIPGIARSQSIPNLLFWSISFITFLDEPMDPGEVIFENLPDSLPLTILPGEKKLAFLKRVEISYGLASSKAGPPIYKFNKHTITYPMTNKKF